MPLLFRQLTICGVGLIGGSLALTARKHRLVERIVGLGRTQARDLRDNPLRIVPL